MTLYEIVGILKQIALSQPNVKTATDGSIYDVMNTNPSVKYDVVHFSQTKHISDEETDYYGFNIFYVSRLEDSLEDNRLQIQSIGKELLDNILRTFCENWSIDFPEIIYYPYTQKFNDLCAGVYCKVEIQVPKELVCADDYTAEIVPGSGIKLQDIGITITQNGLTVLTPGAEYDGIGEVRIVTDVPQTTAVLQDKEVEYTENGSYTVRPDSNYDGLSSVSVDVLVPDRYDEGYDDGKEDGENEQKAKLTVTSFTENNTYTRENGWSAVTVDVPSDYQEGYDDGVADQKAKMVATAITENGEYSRPDGYSTITVNVPQGQGYDEGYEDGEAAQKAKLTATSFTQNDTYTRADGWSSVTVNVQSDYQDGYNDGVEDQKAKMTVLEVTENGMYAREDGYSLVLVEVPATTAYTDLDLIANLQGDYFIIPDGTTHLRDYAFYATCFSSITIPNSVSAIGASAFYSNTCLTSITVPDSVETVGTRAFYDCTALEFANFGTGITNISPNVFGGCSALTSITFEGLVPPTINTANTLGSTAYTFPIYVPCQSLDAYKTAFGTAYAPRIQCKEEPTPTGDTPATAITLVVDSAITDSGQATVIIEPASATTNLVFSSSDDSIATIDQNGFILVVSDGQVTFCVLDTISELQDCKTVTVTKTDTSGFGMAIYNVTSTTNPTKILSISGYNSFDYMIYNGQRTNIGSGTTTYTFPSTGLQIVYYHLINPTTITIATFGANGSEASGATQLVGFRIPQTVTTLGAGAFRYTGLRDIIIPKRVTTIGEECFYMCKSLTAFTFETPATIEKNTGGSLLYSSPLTEFVIPNSFIKAPGLVYCRNLSALTIGSGVEWFYTSDYYQCTGLRNVTVKAITPPDVRQIGSRTTIFETDSLEHIFVPAQSVNAYKTAPLWSNYAQYITAITS